VVQPTLTAPIPTIEPPAEPVTPQPPPALQPPPKLKVPTAPVPVPAPAPAPVTAPSPPSTLSGLLANPIVLIFLGLAVVRTIASIARARRDEE
jgi:hypothetical protein